MIRSFVFIFSRIIVRLLYGDIWNLRKIIREKKDFTGRRIMLYELYWETYGSWIGIGAELEDIPIFPHGPMGIFISNSARIGKKCVLFQQVTIGSNMLKDSKKTGAPTIGNNVYIGCGAKIIGNVHVGDNARIGANAVVVKDVSANSVTVIRGIETIVRESVLDNEYVANMMK